MKERPILFSGPMVQAILKGRKTQTRRVVKDKHGLLDRYTPTGEMLDYYGNGQTWGARLADTTCVIPCPHGRPHDRLWVRETFYSDEHGVRYRADHHVSPMGWKPSIHMPRSVSRIDLEISAIRVERLQNISEADAAAEGVRFDQGWDEEPGYGFLDYSKTDDENYSFTDPRDSFRTLWQSINGKDSWNENPWVWVVEFKKV